MAKKNKYESISSFEDNKTYKNINGVPVLIHEIDHEHQKVHFVINDSVGDMQSFENFLNFMNTGEYSILNF